MSSQHIAAIHQYWSEANEGQSHKAIQESALTIPRLNNWYTTVHRNQLRISGIVTFHSDYPDGATITTSSIRNHMFLADRLLVATKHTLYELGMPLRPQDNKESSQKNEDKPLDSFGTLPDPWGASNNDDTTLRHI